LGVIERVPFLVMPLEEDEEAGLEEGFLIRPWAILVFELGSLLGVGGIGRFDVVR